MTILVDIINAHCNFAREAANEYFYATSDKKALSDLLKEISSFLRIMMFDAQEFELDKQIKKKELAKKKEKDNVNSSEHPSFEFPSVESIVDLIKIKIQLITIANNHEKYVALDRAIQDEVKQLAIVLYSNSNSSLLMKKFDALQNTM